MTIDLSARWRRLLLLLPVGLVLSGAWFAARWCVANTVAEWAPDAAAAQAAARLAPSDPQAHYTLAELGSRSMQPENLPQAVREYELAASLSPHDYRLWLKLGRARELTGDTAAAAGGEKALRRAVELAPGYADPRWFLGNYLLRQGRDAEAFAELQKAAEINPVRYQGPVLDVAWQLYGGNIEAMLGAMGGTNALRAALVDYLLGRQQYDDARRLWQSLDAEQRQPQRALGEKLQRALFGQKQFAAVLDIQRGFGGTSGDTSAAATVQPSVGALVNGGFEGPVAPPGKSFFDWQVVPVAQAQINLDERQRHGGARSLRIIFDATSPLDFRNVSQFVVVEPSARYQLEFYVRAEELKGVSTPLAEVVDAADPARVLAHSAPLQQGTEEWQQVALDFTTGAQAEGITVRLNRSPCDALVCPLFGKVWYDDFTLQRTDGGSGGDGSGGDSVGRRSSARVR